MIAIVCKLSSPAEFELAIISLRAHKDRLSAAAIPAQETERLQFAAMKLYLRYSQKDCEHHRNEDEKR